MERSPGENSILEVDDGGVRLPERKTRRRLIQSKLFACGSQENGAIDDRDGEEGKTEEDDGEEFGGKNSKSKKRKRTTPKKAPRKVQAVNKKATGARNGGLPVTVRSDFFVKVSERKLQLKQEREQQEMVDLTVENDEHDTNLQLLTGKKCEQQMKEKADGNAKSCKNKTPEAGRSLHCRRKVKDNKSNVANDLSTRNATVPQAAFDLRLEAKIASEEYARISAGKQTHPFFSARKAASRSPEPIEIAARLGKWSSYPPVHVFEALQDDLAFMDWKDWEFFESTLFHSSSYSNTGNVCSLASMGSVGPLKFDSFAAISSSNHTPYLQEVGHLDHLPYQRDGSLAISANSNSMLADGEETLEPLLAYLKEHEKKKNVCVGDTQDERRITFLRERMLSCRSHCHNRVGSSLWINKYQPENASEVCGNSEAVKFLSDWLRSWHECAQQSSKHSSSDDSDIQESDSWYQNDSDTENTDGGSTLNNVLLIKGPVGSGKSAAVYACAKEQGFNVIEVNSSDWRHGANVKQNFGEAMESHGFNRWSFEGPLHSQKKHNMDLFLRSNSTSEESDCQIIDVISTTCGQKPVDIRELSENTTEKKTTSSQGTNMALILFEDVDIIFDEDRGFIAALLQLAKTAKRPMILTSNSKNPVLPHPLTRQVVEFTLPSLQDLLSAIYMVCVSEKVDIPLQLIERFVRCCKYDIRKTIMLLQFWCQGRCCQEVSPDWKMQWMYSSLQFDIDAAHWIIPKVLPWGFPWELSTLVDYEVSRALSLVKDGELNYNTMLDDLDMDNNKADIKARKDAILRNCSDNDIGGSAGQFDYVGDLTNASESPVAFTRRTAGRKRNAVLYSDSEDDKFSNDDLLAISEIPLKDHSYEASPDVSAVPLSRLSSPGTFQPSTDQIIYPSGCNLDQELHRDPETLNDPLIRDTYNLVDISHVAESSFVPEDEVNGGNECPSGIISSGHFSLQEDYLTNMKAIQSLAVAEATSIEKSVAEPMLGNSTELDSESVHENEELEDSQSEEAEIVNRGYPMMDECSRADFRFGCASMENPPCPPLVDQVQQTWRKLLGRHEELKSHVTTEQKDSFQIVELAYRMSNLISEADVMFSGCQLLTSDSLDPVAVPCIEPGAVCWYDEQVEMTSTFAEHGFCFYAKNAAAVGSNLSHKNQVDLPQEMLASSNNIVALGKLVRKEMGQSQNFCNSQTELPQIDIFSRREVELKPYGTILSVVPAKSQMALKGATLHEYLSSLSWISKAEASHRLENAHRKRQNRRGCRGFLHYLNGGSFALSPEEISLLAQHGCYGKATSEESRWWR